MLDLAISHNSHKALRLLLETSGPYRAKMRTERPRAVCLGASHGDKETLMILHQANVLILDSQDNEKAVSVKTALSIAERRRDDNENWVQSIFRLTDDDPGAWFDTFKILYDGIIDRHGRKVGLLFQKEQQVPDSAADACDWKTKIKRREEEHPEDALF